MRCINFHFEKYIYVLYYPIDYFPQVCVISGRCGCYTKSLSILELVKSSKFISCNSQMVSLKMKDMVLPNTRSFFHGFLEHVMNREALYTYAFIYQED